jgi:hypothetical protein
MRVGVAQRESRSVSGKDTGVNDFTIVKDGSVFLLRANSAAGQSWIDENVPVASWGSVEIDGQTDSPVTFSFRDGAVVVPPDVMELWIQDIADEGLMIRFR